MVTTLAALRDDAFPAGTAQRGGAAGNGRVVTGTARYRARTPAFPMLRGGELALVPMALVPASDDPAACDLIVLRTVDGFDPAAPTPEHIVRRLAAVGVRSISLAVDVTNYVMVELGQPLHAFDADRVSGTVRARRARDGETLETLDHVQRTLSPRDLVIAAAGIR